MILRKIVTHTSLAAAALLCAASLSFAAQGGFVNNTGNNAGNAAGGFSGPGPEVVTVEQAKQMRDDSKVTLRGTIVQSIGKEKYLFRDGTGTITVEIDDDDWNGLTVSPQDTVEIWGEVDKDWNSVEIDVDRVMKK